MHFNDRNARVARVASLGAVALVAAATIAAQTHPAAAAGIFAAVNSAITCATTGACVSGKNTAGGFGVEGTSEAGYGVYGLGKGTGTGVFGGAKSGWGMYGYSDKNDGIEGVSTQYYGVEGLSYGTNAGAVGVKGSTAGGNGRGVWGTASGSGNGVEGDSAHGNGVSASSQDGIGVNGSSPGGIGVFGSSVTDAGVAGQSNAYPFYGTDASRNLVFYVDGNGDIYNTGEIASAFRAADGTTVAAYSGKSTSPTVEDTGTAQLVGGSATVLLDPVFARTIDAASSYRVFVTANGDTHGLFVARKTALGFAVRENEGGRSTVSFDYRIVATALGHAGQRMAVTKPGAVMPLPRLP